LEIWDIYDKNRRLTGRTNIRGVPLPPGDYILCVRAWIMNGRGEFLITKRTPEKEMFPDFWETTGGSALKGEDSITGILREIKEETGLCLPAEKGALLTSIRRDEDLRSFNDIWLFRCEFDMKDIILQPGETVEAKKAALEEIEAMMESGEFVPKSVLPEFDLLIAVANCGKNIV